MVVATPARPAAGPRHDPYHRVAMKVVARIDRPHHGGRGATTTSPERAQRCNQIWLDPILRDLATSSGAG